MGKKISNNHFSRYLEYPLVIWPTIGFPCCTHLSKYSLKLKTHFEIELWVMATKTKSEPQNSSLASKSSSTLSSITDSEMAALLNYVELCLTHHLHFTPLLGIDPSTRRAVRNISLTGDIISLSHADFSEIDSPAQWDAYLKASKDLRAKALTREAPRAFIQDMAIYGNRNSLIKANISIPITAEIREYLVSAHLLMFDLHQTFEQDADLRRELPHAVCVFRRKNWMHQHLIHISDLHVSKRNDEFLGVIRTNLERSKIKQASKLWGNSLKGIGKLFHRTKDHEENQTTSKEIADQAEISTKKEIDIRPLEERIINPNNNLRRFTLHANHQASVGALDYVIMTGDLVDFCIVADTIASGEDTNYENSNWIRFLDIVLNRDPTPRGEYPLLGLIDSEELLVPFFTTPGNHDYRIGTYPISSIGIYKHLGLKQHEVMMYHEMNSFNPLASSARALLPYYQYINPFLNYHIQFGNVMHIILDSGPDSVGELKHILMADPSVSGFSDAQMTYLYLLGERFFNIHNRNENYDVNHDLTPEEKVDLFFICSHGPILNPIKRKSIRTDLLQKMHLLPQFEIQDYKEHRLREYGEEETRSDMDLEYHAGTIAQNWVNIMGYLERYKGFALNGHTHKWREFRTARTDDPSINYSGAGKKILNPFAIYWDDYSVEYGITRPEYLDQHSPFHFQTPSLGISNSHYNLPAGSYRVVEIEGNKIVKMDLRFLKGSK